MVCLAVEDGVVVLDAGIIWGELIGRHDAGYGLVMEINSCSTVQDHINIS